MLQKKGSKSALIIQRIVIALIAFSIGGLATHLLRGNLLVLESVLHGGDYGSTMYGCIALGRIGSPESRAALIKAKQYMPANLWITVETGLQIHHEIDRK